MMPTSSLKMNFRILPCISAAAADESLPLLPFPVIFPNSVRKKGQHGPTEMFPSQYFKDTRGESLDQSDASFFVQYDFKTRNPKYVVEHLRKPSDGVEGGIRAAARPPFFGEAGIPVDAFRVHPRDYQDQRPFDRGHMAPAADFSPGSERAATFNMLNISPQHADLNRGFWAVFEQWIRMALRKHFQEMVVVTGPVFAPVFVQGRWVYMSSTIGHFPRLIQSAPERFLVRIEQLEAVTGLQFGFLDGQVRAALDAVVPAQRDLALVLSADLTSVPAVAPLACVRYVQDAQAAGISFRHLCCLMNRRKEKGQS